MAETNDEYSITLVYLTPGLGASHSVRGAHNQ